MSKFTYPLYIHEYSISDRVKNSLRIEERPDICEWIESNISLPEDSSYALKGKVRLDSFQRWILRQAVKQTTRKMCIVASVQIGKSFLCEMIAFYLIRYKTGNIMLSYQEAQTASRVIVERLLPVLKSNPELSRYLTKTITNEYINLKNGVLRFATSEAPRTIASFAVPVIIASEVSKYFSSTHDIQQLLEGRKNYFEKTNDWLMLFESSPMWSDDPFGKMTKAISLHVYPHVKLSCCGGWIFMEDKHLEVEDESRDIEFIKNNPNSVYLRCPYCKAKVSHKEHYKLLQNVIFADKPESIIDNQQPDYSNSEIVIHLNKLLNFGYTFNKCIAAFFHAKSQLDGGVSLNTYKRESNGQFIERGEIGDDKPTISINLNKYKNYTIYTPVKFPNEIKFAIVGHDMHKDRVTTVVRGFSGVNTDSFLLDYQEIEHSILENPQIIFEKVRDRIYQKKYIREDGTEIPILRGIMDSADGNTSEIVKYICDRITVSGHKILYKYRGSTQRNPNLIEWHEKSRCYFGDTPSLSKIIGQLIENNNWFLPSDTPERYLTELMGENIEGKKISSNNHTRSCENYIQSQAYLLQCYNPSGKWNEELARLNQAQNDSMNDLVSMINNLF